MFLDTQNSATKVNMLTVTLTKYMHIPNTGLFLKGERGFSGEENNSIMPAGQENFAQRPIPVSGQSISKQNLVNAAMIVSRQKP